MKDKIEITAENIIDAIRAVETPHDKDQDEVHFLYISDLLKVLGLKPLEAK